MSNYTFPSVDPKIIVRRTIQLAVSLLLPVFFLACKMPEYHNEPLQAVSPAARPKNIILLIGDGMALSQISSGLYWKGNGRSVFERFPVVGFHQSHSYDNLITDSAAGATAFSCGIKTYNGGIAVDPDEKPQPTILEQLSKSGYATGMVVTCSATHATPAAFISHQPIRAFSEQIALDYLKTPIDCFIGGGEGYFNKRPDSRNLEDSLRDRGYQILHGTSFKHTPVDGSTRFMQFTAAAEPPTASAGRRYLAPATTTACNFLKNRSAKGFFLMVEGSQIDWALHANDRNWLRAEMLDFDATLLAALKFAAQDGETLVIVTGDHESGGLSLNPGDRSTDFRPEFSMKLHTAAMVPVLAYGPGAEWFSGTYDNTQIYFKMRKAIGF